MRYIYYTTKRLKNQQKCKVEYKILDEKRLTIDTAYVRIVLHSSRATGFYNIIRGEEKMKQIILENFKKTKKAALFYFSLCFF